MIYPNRAMETGRTNVELGLGRRATKAVFVSLISLFLVHLAPQYAAAQSMGVNFFELRPVDQTEAARGQYIKLANHPLDGVCGITGKAKHQARAAKAVSLACAAAAKATFVAYACGKVNNPDPDQLGNARDKGIAFRNACGCDNFCPHDPRTKGPEEGLWKK
jgi:hypothetical protein